MKKKIQIILAAVNKKAKIVMVILPFLLPKKHTKKFTKNINKTNLPHGMTSLTGGGTMEENGCGITALSIILSGYGKNVTPEDLREKYYPVLATEKISTELSSTFGIQNSDFYFDSTHLSKKSILEHLQSNRPILICVWNQPRENRWTEKSHYMVLLATARKRKSLCF